MISMKVKWKSTYFLMVILFLQFIVYALIFFDVPVVRQVVGFVYFTFIPGFVVIKLLLLNEVDRLEIVLFSVGLSIAFLMLTGLLINEFCFLFSISKPLSLLPLMIILNSLILLGAILIYIRGEDVKLFQPLSFKLPFSTLLIGILPFLSVLGAIWVSAYENNLILLFLIIAISLLLVVGVISKKILPPKLYPLVVLMIAISLLYHSSLISNYLVSFGSDNPVEYYVLKVTENDAHWSSVFMYPWDTGYGRINSMLSVTVLPATYSALLNLEATWAFKILYPLIFSFVPLALYQLWRKNMGEKRAFIAAFLFMAQNTFYTEMLGLNRQMIAELFFVLLLLVVLSKEMKPFNKIICFIIFSVALVTSHYALAEIFLFFISIAWVCLFVMKKPSRKITVTIVVFFFVAMFSWYLYTSSSAVFDSLVSFGNHIYDQLDQFFNPASRGETVLRGLGLEAPPTIWNTFSRVFAYLTEFLIGVGFIGLIINRKNIQLEWEHFTFTIIAVAFLVALIAVPGLANTMNMTRFFHILLFFLAPLCVLGAEFLINLMSKRRAELGASILLLTVLVPYFLFQTGFVYEVTGTQNWSLPLSMYRMGTVSLRSLGYWDESDIFGALWMSKNLEANKSKTYADGPSLYFILTSYGMIYRGNMETLSNVTVLSKNDNVYLSQMNVVDGVIVGSHLWNTTSIFHVIGFTSKVYSNGGCEIYKNG
ncbi:MAG: DUF2206 domain-containing protein [Candidatus Bathyarchaeota archaeon]|nr:DUF2206 domain-containing protein [Candidatus Bathyarchaeota archaeon]